MSVGSYLVASLSVGVLALACGRSTKDLPAAAPAGAAGAGAVSSAGDGQGASGETASGGTSSGAAGAAEGGKGGDASAGSPSVRALRIDNRTAAPIYIRAAEYLGCDNGGGTCFVFIGSCRLLCSAVKQGNTCCVQCEPPLPEARLVPAGAIRDIPWDGSVYALEQGPCSECTCGAPVGKGSVEVTVEAFPTVSGCPSSGCAPDANGVIPGATPTGNAKKYSTSFTLPVTTEVVTLIVD